MPDIYCFSYSILVQEAYFYIDIYNEDSSLPGEIAKAQKVSFTQEEKFVHKLGGKFVPFRLHNESCSAEQTLNSCGCWGWSQVPIGEAITNQKSWIVKSFCIDIFYTS